MPGVCDHGVQYEVAERDQVLEEDNSNTAVEQQAEGPAERTIPLRKKKPTVKGLEDRLTKMRNCFEILKEKQVNLMTASVHFDGEEQEQEDLMYKFIEQWDDEVDDLEQRS